MKKIFGSLIVIMGLLAAPSAMAVHTCGQMLGSCLAHWDPITLPDPIEPITIEPVRQPIEAARPIVKKRVGNRTKCYMDTGNGVLSPINCPK